MEKTEKSTTREEPQTIGTIQLVNSKKGKKTEANEKEHTKPIIIGSYDENKQ